MKPGAALALERPAVAAAMSAATGMGHGAATPAPQPTRSPERTERPILRPNGSPGTSCRIATALPNAAAPAKAAEALSKAVWVFMID